MDWLEQRVSEYRQGIDLELRCRCRPYARPDVPCHGDTLKDWILWSSAQRDGVDMYFQGLTVQKANIPCQRVHNLRIPC